MEWLSCERENPAGARFYPQCANPVDEAAPAPKAPEDRDPRAYTPKYLAEKILQSKSAP